MEIIDILIYKLSRYITKLFMNSTHFSLPA